MLSKLVATFIVAVKTDCKFNSVYLPVTLHQHRKTRYHVDWE